MVQLLVVLYHDLNEPTILSTVLYVEMTRLSDAWSWRRFWYYIKNDF